MKSLLKAIKEKKCLFAIFVCLSIIFCFSGCNLNGQKKEVVNENFYCKVIDEDNIAIGNVKTYPKDGAVFFPEQIENYTVSKIGFASGLGFGGNGYLSTSKEGESNIQRCYFPHTIKEVYSGYISGASLKLFYCGEVIDLIGLDAEHRHMEIYVPTEKYELFKNVLSEEYFRGTLLKANVSYHLNYDENNYYYIDYYENGENISYIPPIPQRGGYSFGGWFRENDCINQWGFNTDTLLFSEEVSEIKLYAKWIVKE